MRNLLRLIPAALLGVGTAVLVACGSSGKGLIPSANAGPLQGDFQAVVRAAQEGNCSTTEAQIRKTEHDLHALPASVDGGLRGRLEEGVENLAARARVLCSQPSAQTTTTATTPTATTPPPATATTPSATTPTTPTTPGTETPTEEEGGTPAPGEEGRGAEEESEGGPGRGNGRGRGNGNGDEAGGANPGETGAGEVNGGTAGGK